MKTTITYVLRFAAGMCSIVLMIALYNNWLFDNGLFVATRLGEGSAAPMAIVSVILLAAGGAFALFQIAAFVLYVFTLRREPSPAAFRVLEQGIGKSVVLSYHQRLTTGQRKIVSISAWGVFIYFVVAFLASLSVFEKQEAFFLDNAAVRKLCRPAEWERVTGTENYQNYLKYEPVRRLFYETEDNNVAKYLRDVYKMSRDLKAAGAKAVVADAVSPQWPRTIFPSEKMDHSAILARIDSLDVVIWGSPLPAWNFSHYLQNERVHAGRNEGKIFQPVYSAITDVPVTFPWKWSEAIVRWQPLMKIDTYAPAYNSDVAMMVARKYFDIPDTCAVVTGHKNVSVGSVSIPISPSGTSYCLYITPYGFPAPVSASRGIGGAKGFEYHPDSLRYNVYTGITTSPKDTVKDLLRFTEYYKGAVVVINWMNPAFDKEIYRKKQVSDVISCVLHGAFYTKSDSWTRGLTILAIVLIAVISAFCRVRWIIVATPLVIAGIVACAVWMFGSYRVLFDPFYPIAATMIAAVIYSLLRYIRETP